MASIIDRFFGGLVASILLFFLGVAFLTGDPLYRYMDTDLREWEIGVVLIVVSPLVFFSSLVGRYDDKMGDSVVSDCV